ncbi:MAG: type III-A CRISPR-associated RAMP protein Csm3 [Bacteroidaceae bacterium]|nr:type III-A CRISPR-associated RAMP protein Csm3 [Bacteroidaceae bacterium]
MEAKKSDTEAIAATIRLIKKIIYTGTLTLKTGLHIGGSNSAMNIGGPDKFVVRNSMNGLPYIPGSSLKGKMRSLIEISEGNSTISTDPDSISGSLFGIAVKESKGKASRLIVRDCELITEDPNDKNYKFDNTDLPYTETKTEASIDRVTSVANPRTFERVPAGAKFKVNMVLNIFEGEDESKLKNTLKRAIELLEDDYLGGSGSRGYGQVDIELEEIEKKVEEYGK